MKVCKPYSLPSHTVNIRGIDPAIIKAHIATTKIISKDEHKFNNGSVVDKMCHLLDTRRSRVIVDVHELTMLPQWWNTRERGHYLKVR